MNASEQILALAEVADSTAALAKELKRSYPELALYAIERGIEAIKSHKRRNTRKRLKREVGLELVPNPNTGGYRFSQKCQQRILTRSRDFFDEYPMPGGLNLGDCTYGDLVEHAAAEAKSGNGHIINFKFYSALAEPITGTSNRVRDYWDPRAAKSLRLKIAEEILTQ